MDFSESERRIFAAIATAMAGESAGEDVAPAVSPFLAHLPKLDRASLSVLLRAIEYGAPLLTGRPRRFTRLDPEEREALLRSWLESRLALRRQAAASLRALSMIGLYGREAAWEDVGYHGPWLGRIEVPVLPAPDLRAGSGVAVAPAASERPPRPRRAPALAPGISRGREIDRDLRIRTQVCVIGTGAGGAAALARLAEHGIDAVAVEAGGHHTAAEFTQRELEMLPLLYQEAGLRATADKAIGILQGKGVGGSTLHNTGLVYPTPRGIAERWRTEHGFPLDEATLGRYVAEAVETLGGVPIPPERINANNEVLRRGAEALGWRYRISLHNRQDCCGCGYCMLGCAYNRKSNATLSWLPRAVATGARVLSDAAAERIEGSAGSRRVICELRDSGGRPTGHRALVEAPVVLLAAGALDTPALLLRSGLGNERVGRGLRLHPSPLVSAILPEPVRAWRGLPQSVLIEEFASFQEDGRGGFLLLPSAANWPALSAVVAPGIGRVHRERMRGLPHTAAVAVLLHDETEGRVTAARGSGRPVAHYWPDDGDMKGLRHGVRAAARIYLAAGAERVDLPYADAPPVRSEAELDAALKRAQAVRHRFSLNSVHPQGSCPLGVDARYSATDPHGELWGERGIFIADASQFPTSAGVPPQVTTMALACAVADYVAGRQG